MNVLMSADAERCLKFYIVQYFTLNHPFSRDSTANTIIQCVGYIALDAYGVDQKILLEYSRSIIPTAKFKFPFMVYKYVHTFY